MTPQLKQFDSGPSVGQVKRWNQSRSSAAEDYARSHIDNLPSFEKALVRVLRGYWRALLIVIAIGVPFIFIRIVCAFVSGRAGEILDAIQKASR